MPEPRNETYLTEFDCACGDPIKLLLTEFMGDYYVQAMHWEKRCGYVFVRLAGSPVPEADKLAENLRRYVHRVISSNAHNYYTNKCGWEW